MTQAQPFSDLDHYVALPRWSGLTATADGSRLVGVVSAPEEKGTKYVNSLWEIDPTGKAAMGCIRNSPKGDLAPVFTDRGDLLFKAVPPSPDSKDEDGATDSAVALWLAGANGGQPRVICDRPGGVGEVQSHAEVVAFSAGVLPGASDEAGDAQLRKQRREGKISAILYDSYPIRHWDHDLTDIEHIFVAPLPPVACEEAGESTEPEDVPAGQVAQVAARLELRDLTPWARRGEIGDFSLSPDGKTVVLERSLPQASGDRHQVLVAIDVASGQVTTLVDRADMEAGSPVCGPDGRVVFCQHVIASPAKAAWSTLWVMDLAGGELRQVAAEWDREATQVVWAADGNLLVVADENGRAPIFHIDLSTDTVTRITQEDAAFTNVHVTADGKHIFALMSSYLAPSQPVRLEIGQMPIRALALPTHLPSPELPGRLEEVAVTVADGSRVRAWLALPATASSQEPAPLVLWVHGGPLGSWNSWSWRWCPWLLVARGYAVLLPDPALSTGYGEQFIARGWNSWGDAPFTDLLEITKAVCERADIDSDRTAAMGGSFGGYMANWIAGHTDQFRAIVTHASLWNLQAFSSATDHAFYWRREMDEEMTAKHSPHAYVANIKTPMLVVHGDKDYRVPIGEGLQLWYDLLSQSALPMAADGATAHRFLYFPAENHWVLTPQHAKIWYETVIAFLNEHVL